MADNTYTTPPMDYDPATRTWMSPEDHLAAIHAAAMGGGANVNTASLLPQEPYSGDAQFNQYLSLLRQHMGSQPAPEDTFPVSQPVHEPAPSIDPYHGKPHGLLDVLAPMLASLSVNTGNYRNQGLASVLSAGANVLGGLRMQDIRRRADVQSALDQAAHDRNALNLEATKAQIQSDAKAKESRSSWLAARAGHVADKTADAQINAQYSTPKAAASAPDIVSADDAKRIPWLAPYVGWKRSEAVSAGKPPAKSGDGADGFDPSQYVDTSESGVNYISTSRIPDKKKQQVASEWASKNGVAFVNDRQQKALDLVGEARGNLQAIEASASDFLPKSAGERLYKGPSNIVAGIAQTNPEVAGFKAYRTAAINAIQAIAGLGSGLRINQAEIQAALKNDIPRETDTIDVMRVKLGNLRKMLDNAERGALGLHGAPSPQAAPAAAPTAPAPIGKVVRWVVKNGKLVPEGGGK